MNYGSKFVKTSLMYAVILACCLLQVSCVSSHKPIVHLHLSNVDKDVSDKIQSSLNQQGYQVLLGEEDFSHFLFTPLIVIPNDHQESLLLIERTIFDTFGAMPIVKRGNFKNHQYKAQHIGLYIRGH